MKQNTYMETLRAHLKGYDIPRSIAHRVCEVLNVFRNLQVDDAYNAIALAKEVLTKLADFYQGSLTQRQRIAIVKSYHVIKYSDNLVRKEFLNKDLTAIATFEATTANVGCNYLKRGLRTIDGTWRRCDNSSESIITLATRVLVNNSTENKPFTIERLSRKIVSCISAWHSLPQPLRNGRRWEQVFGSHNYALMLEAADSLNEIASADSLIGNVRVTFEQGMKPRLFASPMIHYQAYLEPLKRYLQNICRNIPEDFHGDQQAGREDVQSKLQSGQTVHCFDLSSATHLFPWSLQLRMLRMMGVSQDLVNMTNHCSKGMWRVDVAGIEPIKWQSGQPLGLGPSFFVFSLCHHALIRGLFDRLGEDHNGGYALLGDDVAIYNNRVAKAYVKLMGQIGCKVNMDKSIISNKIAEFAGSTITVDDIINVGKYRDITFGSELDYNMRWTKPSKHYAPIVSYLKGEVENDFLRKEYVSQMIAASTHKIISHVGIWSPAHAVKKLNAFYEAENIPYRFDSQHYDAKARTVAQAIVAIFEDCPDCFPSAVTPHLLSDSMKILIGTQELVQAAINDSFGGCAIPLWYNRLMDIFNSDASREFSIPRLLREANKFICMNLISTLCTTRAVTNRYIRALRKALRSYEAVKVNGDDAIWLAIMKLHATSGLPISHPAVEQGLSERMVSEPTV